MCANKVKRQKVIFYFSFISPNFLLPLFPQFLRLAYSQFSHSPALPFCIVYGYVVLSLRCCGTPNSRFLFSFPTPRILTPNFSYSRLPNYLFAPFPVFYFPVPPSPGLPLPWFPILKIACTASRICKFYSSVVVCYPSVRYSSVTRLLLVCHSGVVLE
jgi:hypothetical protein